MGGSSSGDDFEVDGDVEGNQVGDKFRKVEKIFFNFKQIIALLF